MFNPVISQILKFFDVCPQDHKKQPHTSPNPIQYSQKSLQIYQPNKRLFQRQKIVGNFIIQLCVQLASEETDLEQIPVMNVFDEIANQLNGSQDSQEEDKCQQKKPSCPKKQQQLTSEAHYYKQFQKKYPEITLQYIRNKVIKTGSQIKINEKQIELFDSQDKGRVQFEYLSKNFVAEFYLYISVFIITARVQFVFKKLPFRQESGAKKGGFGEIFFTKNEKNKKVCAKVIRKTSTYFELLHDALKQFGMYKLASALGVGPEVYVLDVVSGDEKQNNTQVDILMFDDGLYFQMELCDQITSAIPYWNPRDSCQSKKLQEIEDVRMRFEENMIFKMRLMHSLKLVHRDIKPYNIVYSKNKNEFFFIDFGFAHSVKELPDQKTKIQYFAGTVNFASQQLLQIINKNGGEVNLYYNDLFALQKTFKEFGKMLSGEQEIPAHSANLTYKKNNLNLKEGNNITLLDKTLRVFKAIFGINRNIQLLWRLKIELQTLEQKKIEEKKKILKYKKYIWSCFQYKQVCFFQNELCRIKKQHPDFNNEQIFQEMQQYQLQNWDQIVNNGVLTTLFLTRWILSRQNGEAYQMGSYLDQFSRESEPYIFFAYEIYRMIIWNQSFFELIEGIIDETIDYFSSRKEFIPNILMQLQKNKYLFNMFYSTNKDKIKTIKKSFKQASKIMTFFIQKFDEDTEQQNKGRLIPRMFMKFLASSKNLGKITNMVFGNIIA